VVAVALVERTRVACAQDAAAPWAAHTHAPPRGPPA
jgi:hypothetical protein